jgi:CRP-like cAMP-binding protein
MAICTQVEHVGAGSLIGVSAGFADRNYVFTARALSATDTIYISREQIIRSLRMHPDIRMVILASLSENVQRAIRYFVAPVQRENLIGNVTKRKSVGT